MAAACGAKRGGKNSSHSASSADPLTNEQKVSVHVDALMAAAEGFNELDVSAMITGLQTVLHRKIAARS